MMIELKVEIPALFPGGLRREAVSCAPSPEGCVGDGGALTQGCERLRSRNTLAATEQLILRPALEVPGMGG
eukprot:38835-Prymnesium_polylepis.5